MTHQVECRTADSVGRGRRPHVAPLAVEVAHRRDFVARRKVRQLPCDVVDLLAGFAFVGAVGDIGSLMSAVVSAVTLALGDCRQREAAGEIDEKVDTLEADLYRLHRYRDPVPELLARVPVAHEVTLLSLLKIHEPNLKDIDRKLRWRIDSVADVEAELVERYQAGGAPELEAAIRELETSRDGIVRARDDVASFVREHFPVGPSGGAGE